MKCRLARHQVQADRMLPALGDHSTSTLTRQCPRHRSLLLSNIPSSLRVLRKNISNPPTVTNHLNKRKRSPIIVDRESLWTAAWTKLSQSVRYQFGRSFYLSQADGICSAPPGLHEVLVALLLHAATTIHEMASERYERSRQDPQEQS